MKSNASILTMYAITPCHAGSGASMSLVDLPIQRERHTQWPIVASSGLKGAMRAHFERFKSSLTSLEEKIDEKNLENITDILFGSEKAEYAGAVSVSDLKILAFPIRSNVAPFVWITCPAVLKRLARDLKFIDNQINFDFSSLERLDKNKAYIWNGVKDNSQILLEDMEVTADGDIKNEDIENLRKYFSQYFKDAERLIIVHDSIFDYAVTQCTQITAQIKIDQKTGTAADGALRYQEELPADTIMYCMVFFQESRAQAQDSPQKITEDKIQSYFQKVINSFIQIGGDETLGRGIFQIEWR